MIGHVQRRKAPRLVGMADLVHSIDSVRLAERLSNAALEAGEVVSVLVQVNTSGEESKAGFHGGGQKDEVLGVLALPGLEVRGLMTMAPFTDDEALLRRTFEGVRTLHEELRPVEGVLWEPSFNGYDERLRDCHRGGQHNDSDRHRSFRETDSP